MQGATVDSDPDGAGYTCAQILALGACSQQIIDLGPYKIPADNFFRAATEIHIFLMIGTSLVLRSLPADAEELDGYDWMLYISFLVLVPGGFALTVTYKLYQHRKDGSRDSTIAGAFTRKRLGFASEKDTASVSNYIARIRAVLDPEERRRLGNKLHFAVQAKEFQHVEFLLARGADAGYVLRSGITPLHRAVWLGDLEIAEVLLVSSTDCIDAQTEYGYTALHMASIGGHDHIVKLLLERSCDTSLAHFRNRTAWDLSLLSSSEGSARVAAAFNREAGQGHEALMREHERRESRPEVAPTREDLEMDPLRLEFWALEEGSRDHWEYLAEGGFGKVYLVPAFPPLEGVSGARFGQVAIKAAKTGAQDELSGEIKGLAELSHANIVSILGFTHCSPEPGEAAKWLMLLEYCQSDVEKLLYGGEPDGVLIAVDRESRSPRQLMLDLAHQIALGMEYIHSASVTHLDLKPENVLLRNEGSEPSPQWHGSRRLRNVSTSRRSFERSRRLSKLVATEHYQTLCSRRMRRKRTSRT
eukprot:COSAG04_NODE_1029_length_8668_cov_5.545104_3_plen_530_part_00